MFQWLFLSAIILSSFLKVLTRHGLIVLSLSMFFPCNSEKEKNKSELDQHNGSETDLTVVLNAWYSAGFYTGKYVFTICQGFICDNITPI